jgi:hypothetical protein
VDQGALGLPLPGMTYGSPLISAVEESEVGYLDELKQRSEALRQEQEQKLSAQEQAKTALEQLQPCMDTIRAYLAEAVDVLNFVKPDVMLKYHIEGFGPLENLDQGGYSITEDERDGIVTVTLRFECVSPNSDVRVFNIKEREPFIRQREYMWRNNLQFKDKPTMGGGGTFYLEPRIIVRLEFSPDPQRRKIKLRMRNMIGLGTDTRWIEPEKINKENLDDIMGLVLRKAPDLVKLSTGQMTEEMRNRIKEELRRMQNAQRLQEVQAAATEAEREKAEAEANLVSKLRLGGLGRRK